ncbi:beta-N-acetylhexosaminidase [Aspergillus tanneri]|nr:uncharacterized protein ATNIH1004_006406 [Aspergillus tanneri]KAA8647709.1 hypothetical protein ATNIH1004_006406 [Aspergillus tanneri]
MRSTLLLTSFAVVSALQSLPPVQWAPTGPEDFNIAAVERTIYIRDQFASHRDQGGLTLIPPSALEFAQTFSQDLKEVTGSSWDVQTVDVFPPDRTGIFLDQVEEIYRHEFIYENGKPTEEGYELDVQSDRVLIRGSGARGMWWGSRTLLQQLLLADKKPIPSGRVVDAPSFSTRGFLLDAGRKWYSPSYLKDLCTYASFFKMSEFHYHTSDNVPLSRGHNETWNEMYAQFALLPESPELQGIVQRRNETLTRADFEDLQHHCAQRGVTVIPEIESPGHCLFVTKWKPELALEQKDLLNLSHPDTIPLVKSIWAEFLPWFQTKEVNVGADEYDPTLADVYIDFVNELARFVDETSGKKVRIWGTYEPSENRTISKDIIIQHWQYGQSDPVALANEGYETINSEDWWAYMSLKNDHTPIFPAAYPQFFNNTRLLNFAGIQGWQWDPSLFNPFNASEQPNLHIVKGSILAAWNDNGPDATTQLESYYAFRNGIPTVASRAWSGHRGPQLDVSSLSTSVGLLTGRAVAQNLDRQLPTNDTNPDSPLFDWTAFPSDKRDDKTRLGKGSKGMNYTLDLDITGPFHLYSPDVTLELSPDGALTFVSDGWRYPLRSIEETDGFDEGYPGRIWVNQTASTHEEVQVPLSGRITIKTDVIGGSRVWVDGKFQGRFEVFVFGGKNKLFSWSQMAFVAPLEWVKGGVKRLTVRAFNGQH